MSGPTTGEPAPDLDADPDQQPSEATEEAVDLTAVPGGVRAAVEAVLMVVEDPITETDLATAVGRPVAEVQQVVDQLSQEYQAEQRGFTLRRLAGGWRVYSRADLAPVVERFVLDGQRARLTQAALETLAIIAYRQPVSRAQVGAIRGVNVEAVVRTLVNRGLVEEVGSDPEHGAVLYGTTGYFLQRIGVDSLSELPPLAPHLPELSALADLAEGDA